MPEGRLVAQPGWKAKEVIGIVAWFASEADPAGLAIQPEWPAAVLGVSNGTIGKRRRSLAGANWRSRRLLRFDPQFNFASRNHASSEIDQASHLQSLGQFP